MEGKLSTQNAEIIRFGQLIMSDVSEKVRCSDRENFSSPNFRRFAVECDK